MTTTARKSRCRKSPPARSKAVLVVEESPIRAIACLKKIDDIKRFEETDDCFILGFDPSDNSPVDASSRPHNNDADDDDDLCVLGEKGKVNSPLIIQFHQKPIFQLILMKKFKI